MNQFAIALALLAGLLGFFYAPIPKVDRNQLNGFDPLSILVQIAIGLAISTVGYMLAPKPKQQKPPEARDLENPTADAGRPVPVVFGTIEVKGLNILWYGEKDVYQYEVDADSGEPEAPGGGGIFG